MLFRSLLRTSLAGAAESARAVWPRSRRFRVVAVTVLGFWGLSTVRAINAMKVRAYEGSSVGTAPLAEVAREVRARIPEGAPIYGSGNFAAVLAVTHHPSASRYFNDYPLLVAGYGPRHVRILATELTAKPPAAIVRVPGTCPIVEPAPECTPASVTLAAFARGRYTLRRSIGDYEVWIRNTP